jgi:tRNA A37 threonylcarbamoyladenosine modification protein TsaB
MDVSVFVISLATPILVGIYEDNTLIKTISKTGKTSEVLPVIMKEVIDNYNIKNIIYVNGPGSYMAIKIAYIFLKTLSITKDIKLFASSGFETNKNSPIKALGKKYFVIDSQNNIELKLLDENDILNDFILPQNININNYSQNTLPNYQLPVV